MNIEVNYKNKKKYNENGINILLRSDLYMILEELCNKLTSLDLKSGSILNYVIDNEDGSFTISSCNGVEFQTEKGLIKRIYDDSDEEDIIITDVPHLNMYLSFIKTIIKCLKECETGYILFAESY